VKVRKGQALKKGDALSDGFINPRDLLPLKGMQAVQDQIAGDLYDVLKTVAPVRKRNIEMVVKSATDSTIIDDPGDHPEWIRGDRRKISQVNAWNRKSKGKKVKHDPELFGIDTLPKMLQEDWIAQLNYQDLSRSLANAASQGFRSKIHGFHPIPALAFAKEFGKSDGVMGEY
jgi:DNA-directed RNA polymerase subunit beta'